MNNGLVPQQIQEMIADRLIIMQESNLGWKLDCHSCKPPSFVQLCPTYHQIICIHFLFINQMSLCQPLKKMKIKNSENDKENCLKIEYFCKEQVT